MQSFRRKWHIDKSFLPVSKAEPTQSRTATIPEQQKPQKHRLETKVGTSGLTYGTGVQSVGSLAGDTGEFLHYQEQRRRLLICICTCTCIHCDPVSSELKQFILWGRHIKTLKVLKEGSLILKM